jgi:hypothetical protein
LNCQNSVGHICGHLFLGSLFSWSFLPPIPHGTDCCSYIITSFSTHFY